MLLTLLLFPLLASCATLPAARIAEPPWAALSSDGDLYLFVDVRQARGLLEPLAAPLEGGKPGRMAPLLDRAEGIYACLFLPGASPEAVRATEPAVELAMTGRFSPNLVGMRLDFSCGWVRREPAQPLQPYWRARGHPLEVSAPARGLLLAAEGRPDAMERMLARRLRPETGPVERARAGDPRVGPFLAGAALYACLPSRSVADAAGEGQGLVVRQLWVAARRQGDLYELGALAALAGETNARALASLVRLAAAAWLRKAGIGEVPARLRALEIITDADGLSVRGLRLSEAELLAVLRGFVEGSGARGGD